MVQKLYTIGYEGADLDDFVCTLVDQGITHLIDVRDVPASRRRGFSKNSLSETLAEAGISYTHLKPLGDPKPGREAMRRGDVGAFTIIYNTHIATDLAVDALKTAAAIAVEEPSVLLCYERSPKDCHRSIVAGLLEQIACLKTTHLGVRTGRERINARKPSAVHAIG